MFFKNKTVKSVFTTAALTLMTTAIAIPANADFNWAKSIDPNSNRVTVIVNSLSAFIGQIENSGVSIHIPTVNTMKITSNDFSVSDFDTLVDFGHDTDLVSFFNVPTNIHTHVEENDYFSVSPLLKVKDGVFFFTQDEYQYKIKCIRPGTGKGIGLTGVKRRDDLKEKNTAEPSTALVKNVICEGEIEDSLTSVNKAGIISDDGKTLTIDRTAGFFTADVLNAVTTGKEAFGGAELTIDSKPGSEDFYTVTNPGIRTNNAGQGTFKITSDRNKSQKDGDAGWMNINGPFGKTLHHFDHVIVKN